MWEHVSQTYGPSRPVTGVCLRFFTELLVLLLLLLLLLLQELKSFIKNIGYSRRRVLKQYQ
jgi:hypothetical protein